MKTWALLILGMLLIAWVISDMTPSLSGFTQPRTTVCDSCLLERGKMTAKHDIKLIADADHASMKKFGSIS